MYLLCYFWYFIGILNLFFKRNSFSTPSGISRRLHMFITKKITCGLFLFQIQKTQRAESLLKCKYEKNMMIMNMIFTKSVDKIHTYFYFPFWTKIYSRKGGFNYDDKYILFLFIFFLIMLMTFVAFFSRLSNRFFCIK